MFFVLSKLLVYLIFPFTWVIILFAWYFLCKSPKRKRRLLIAAVAILFLFSNAWLLNLFAGIWEPEPKTIPAGKKYSCAIVLGGFVAADRNDSGYFTLASDRFIQGVKLYQTGAVDHILVSGGNGSLMKHAFRESKWAETQLLAMGVPQSGILIENDSRNTLENAAFSKRVLDSAGLKPPYVLVTSAFHMPRSLWCYKQEGMNVIPYPCNYFAGRGKFNITDLFPQAHVMDLWFVYIKELVGYCAYEVKAKFKR